MLSSIISAAECCAWTKPKPKTRWSLREKPTLSTLAPCGKIATGRNVVASHTRTRAVVAARDEAGAIGARGGGAHRGTMAADAEALPVRHAPDGGGAVETRGDEPRAVAEKSDGNQIGGMLELGERARGGPHVPDARLVIHRAGRETRAGGIERDRRDHFIVLHDADRLLFADAPEERLALPARLGHPARRWR
jgi:hypothetical protein